MLSCFRHSQGLLRGISHQNKSIVFQQQIDVQTLLKNKHLMANQFTQVIFNHLLDAWFTQRLSTIG